MASAVYPMDLAPRLIELDYRIEADTSLAAQGPRGLSWPIWARPWGGVCNAAFQLMLSQSWDFFHLHIMGGDRVNHFYWGQWEDGGPAAAGFDEFYRRMDSYIGELAQHLPPGCRLVVLSEHGFTRAKGTVFINRWLEENGYLHFSRGRKELRNMHPESKAYSLVPGRIYINLEGREERGRVANGKPYEELREELVNRLSGLPHPETGQPVLGRVLRREEIYSGPHISRAPDLVIEPLSGYDLKANLTGPGVVGPPELSGVHTFDDAFLYTRRQPDAPVRTAGSPSWM